MKKLCIQVLVLTLLSLSCQKSNNLSQKANMSTTAETSLAVPVASYFLTFQIDGITKRFNINPAATKIITSWNFTVIQIKGFSSSPAPETFIISIDNTLSAKPIVPGVYADNSPLFSLNADYITASAQPYHAGSSVLSQSETGITKENAGFNTTITSFSNGEIKGVFNGDFYENNDPNAKKITVTNGAFYVRLN